MCDQQGQKNLCFYEQINNNKCWKKKNPTSTSVWYKGLFFLAGILCNEKEIIKFASKDNIIVKKCDKSK